MTNSRKHKPEPTPAERVLIDLVETIEITGGVWRFRDGTVAPKGDDEWIDLGDVYLKACEVLGYNNPLIEEYFELDDEET